MKHRAIFIAALLLAVAAGGLARPVAHLYSVWQRDPTTALPEPKVGVDDHSRLHQVEPGEVIAIAPDTAAAEAQIAALVRRAAEENLKISISGGQHSMGGHTLTPGGITLDMRPFAGMTLDAEHNLLRVGSGARWSAVIPYLDQQGRAVAIMQSNNDFTVGGSISVNCHGWQPHSPPIAHSVEAFRLITADGVIRRCSRTENAELFSLALGGYGLFGVILDVELRVVPDEWYLPETHRLHPRDYAGTFARLTRERPEIGMAYGRISVAPGSFLEETTLTLLTRTPPPERQALHEMQPPLLTTSRLPRLIFRGSAGSNYGKDLRWNLETRFGQMKAKPVSRNEVMNVPSGWFANRESGTTEILHEYFIPPAQLAAFLDTIRPLLLQSGMDLLNITVRDVQTDPDTFLRFAREEVFGLVMLFSQRRNDPAEEERMITLTQNLIDAALAHGGTYYLPYRLHATPEQFQRTYPMAKEFFALKQKYDPQRIFSNQFFETYKIE